MLMGQPVPLAPVDHLVVPRAEICSHYGSRCHATPAAYVGKGPHTLTRAPDPRYGGTIETLAPGQYGDRYFRVLVHEACHAIQHQRGGAFWTPAAERECRRLDERVSLCR